VRPDQERALIIWLAKVAPYFHGEITVTMKGSHGDWHTAIVVDNDGEIQTVSGERLHL
jgi:hypothetical protein